MSVRAAVRVFLFALLRAMPLPASLRSQLMFAAPAQFGNQTGLGRFQEQNGQVSAFPTGFFGHFFPSVSRDNRFIAFSSPDLVMPGVDIPPSSEFFLYDRALGQARQIVDHTSAFIPPNSVLSFTAAALSPNNQLLAYGVVLTRREGLVNPTSTKELNMVNAITGTPLANPTSGRGLVSDEFQGEFARLSWDPAGTSSVTPNDVSVPTQSGGLQSLSAIVRFAFNPGTGTWFRSAVVSFPRSFDRVAPRVAETQIRPVISPSGARLAYLQPTWPDAIGPATRSDCAHRSRECGRERSLLPHH